MKQVVVLHINLPTDVTTVPFITAT